MGYINPPSKLLRWPDRLAAWRAGQPFAPIGIELDLTNRCNLGCDGCHCAYTHTRGPHAAESAGCDLGDEMDLDLVKWLMPEMFTAGVKSVTFSGGGEPLLYPQFELAGYCAVRAGLKLGVYTNGTQLSNLTAHWLKEHAAWVVVSLDAESAADYCKAKGVNAFDRACAGIRYLTEAHGPAVIGVSFLLNRTNYDKVREMVTLARSLGAHYTEFRPMVRYDLNDPDISSEASTDWVGTALPFLRRVQASDVEIRWDKFERYTGWTRGYHTCYAVQFTGVITPNGKMWMCVNRRGLPESEIGDLAHEGFADVWARVKAVTVNPRECRILCRGDVLNLTLAGLAMPVVHEEFI